MSTVRIQLRRGTAANWTSVNPVLAAGEAGFESDTRKIKVGDGSTSWTSLDYVSSDAPAIGEIAQDAINSALVAGTGLDKTYDDVANTITIDIDSTVATLTGIQTLTNKTLTTPTIASFTNATHDHSNSAGGGNLAFSAISTALGYTPADAADVSALSTSINTATIDATTVNTVDLNVTGDVTGLVKGDVGLGNVDNTSDANKPVSTATQTALNLKANLASPTFTGTPLSTTAAPLTNNTQIATTAYTDAAVAAIVDGAPALLNTLNELAAAINDDESFSSTIATSIGGKVSKSGDTMSGQLAMDGNKITGLGSPTTDTDASTKKYVDDQNTIGETLFTAHVNNTTSVHGIADTSALATVTQAADIADNRIAASTTIATKTYADAAVNTHSGDSTNVHGIADTAELATKDYTTNSILDHNNDTTSVHGISDTSALSTKTYADNSVSTHAALTSTHGVTGSIVGTSDTQTLTNKTFTSPKINENVAITATSTELNYVDGVTSSIQTQLDDKLASSTAASTYAPIASPTFTGTVSGVTKTMVGLGNVDNTSDTNKPISTATQTALDAKAPIASPTFTGTVSGVTKTMVGLGNVDNTSDENKPVSTATQTALDLKANLSSPTFTGTVTLPSGTVTSGMILDGTIVNADISATAAIALSKLATDPLARANHTGTQTASTISDFDTQVRTSKVTDLTAPTGSFSMNSQKITNLGTPTTDYDAATKAYVDAAVNNINVHESVVAATTANVNLTNAVDNGKTLDGVTLSTGNRILVKNQSTASANGIYIVASNGAPTRATDYDAAGEVSAGDFIFVKGGTVNANTGWIQTADVTTVGTDSLTFTQFSGAGTYTANNGLTLSGTAFSINTAITADLTTAQTLTNKTLTSPILTTPALGTPASGVMTNVTGLPLTTGVTGTLPVANGGTGVTTSTGSGNNVLSTSPTLVTPVLGTPTSVTLTNATGLPISTGISGLGTGVATALAVNVGSSGAAVINGGALGTPSSGTLTNATGLPLTTGVTGTLPVANGGTGITSIGSGIATFWGTPSSANLAAALTDETGTGSVVFSNSPTLVAPTLGAASATSIAFSDGTQSKEGVPSRTPVNAKLVDYTLALTDRDSLLDFSPSTASIVTIPPNSSVAFPVGTSIDVLQSGTGQVSIAGGSGVTVNGTPGLKLRTQWSSCTLFKRATDSWVVMGDLTA